MNEVAPVNAPTLLKDVDNALNIMSMINSEDKCRQLLESVKATLAANQRVAEDATIRLQKIADVEKRLEALAEREKGVEIAKAEMGEFAVYLKSFQGCIKSFQDDLAEI